MKKLNLILHETTIIDFPFLGALMKRYWYLAFVIPVAVFSLGIYQFYNQNDIVKREVFFNNISAGADSPDSAIASVLGEGKSGLDETDIIGILKSLDFQKEFAQSLYKHPDFLNLDLLPVNSKKKFDMKEFLASCDGYKECIYKKIRAGIFSHIAIKPDRIVSSRFVLEVISRDKFTTTLLLKEISKFIEKSRIENIRHKIEDQIDVTKQLVAEKKKEVEDLNLDDLNRKKKALEEKKTELRSKIASYDSFFHKLKLDLDFMETKVSETKKATQSSVKTDKIIDFQKRKRLEEQIKKLESDIGAIRLVSENLSKQDEMILSQLRNELSEAKNKLSVMGNRGRAVSSEVKFLDRKEGESSFTEFDYKVKKEQYEKTKNDYEKLISEKEKLALDMNEIENEIEHVIPTYEYLKLLENKLIQLKLMNSSVVSDLKFEQELGPVVIFKKMSKLKSILFSFVGSIVLMVSVIVLLYLFDDKIYNKNELEKTFDDLTVIGNTPDFK